MSCRAGVDFDSRPCPLDVGRSRLPIHPGSPCLARGRATWRCVMESGDAERRLRRQAEKRLQADVLERMIRGVCRKALDKLLYDLLPSVARWTMPIVKGDGSAGKAAIYDWEREVSTRSDSSILVHRSCFPYAVARNIHRGPYSLSTVSCLPVEE